MNNVIPIVFCTNSNYAKYLIVTIQSIIEHSNKNFLYDIYILHSENNIKYETIIKSMITDNVKITFYNISNLLSDTPLLNSQGHITIETYYRFYIPELFYKKFNKIIYLDCDLILEEDVSNLFNIPLDGKMIGAVKNPKSREYSEYREFCLNIPEDLYFNAGVLLMDINSCYEYGLKEKFYKIKSEKKYFISMDQDILNIIFKDNVKYIDYSWNFQWGTVLYQNNYKDSKEINELYKNKKPNLIHYTTSKKPWNTINKYSKMWWLYARKSPIYKNLLSSYLKIMIKHYIKNIFSTNKYQKDYYIYKKIILLGKEINIKIKPCRYNYYKTFFEKINNFVNCKDNIDTLILGSSYLEKGYRANNNEYNLAITAQDLYYSYNLYKKYNNENIKNIILSYSVFSPGVSLIKTINRDLCAMYKTGCNIEYQYSDIAKEKKLYNLENCFKNFIKKYNKNNTDNNYRGNFVTYPCNFINVERPEIVAFKHLKSNNNDSQLIYLKQLLNETSNNKQNVYIVITPVTEEYQNLLPDKQKLFKSLFNAIDVYAHVKVIDLYNSELFNKEDFFDYDHLNLQGANKLTKEIRAYVIDT